MLNLYQGGLGLPDESYYRDEQYGPIREAYTEFLPEMLALAGLPDAADKAGRIYELESQLAAGHWDRVRSQGQLADLQPDGPRRPGRTAAGRAVGRLARRSRRRRRRCWSRWSSGNRTSSPRWPACSPPTGCRPGRTGWPGRSSGRARPSAPADLVEKNFDFYGRTLSGVPQLRERWKRGVSIVEAAAGEALGRLYVERHFPPAAKQRMDELVANLLAAYRRDISELSWMSDETKARALEKLAAFTPKIGYPDKWRDYSALVVRADDLAGNARRAAAFELDRQLAKIGQPVDRLEWFMSPQTVNAYYNPGMNEIVFPAAILQPPFFDPDADDAVNYGGIGAVIGHEIGHGFDDQGSKYDGRGALHDWWTAADRAAFEALTGKLIEQYAALEPAQTPGHQVNGALTVGENIGDLGGLAIAFQAWRISLDGREAEVIDGLTGAQRFFLSWAAVWQTKIRDAELLRLLSIDPHSPAEFRCNQVVRNLDEFYDAFGVQAGDGLWLDPADRVRIW